MTQPTVSVVIPTYNEAATIQQSLSALAQQQPDDVVVVDGGSTDDTVSLVNGLARIVPASKGRAVQMNAGARAATGDVVLFLHADTRLPDDGIARIRELVARGIAAGRFRVQFDDRRLALRVFASYTRFHCFSYGDQGFFVTRALFAKLNGFAEDAVFEDIDFYARLRACVRPHIIVTPVTTSARRFITYGPWRQKWRNLVLAMGYYLGFDVRRRVQSWYPDVR